jgi:hypothetical protein
MELRIYKVFDSKEIKSFEKYEKKSVSVNVLADMHGSLFTFVRAQMSSRTA